MIFKANIKDFKQDNLDLLKMSLACDLSEIIKGAFKEGKDIAFVCVGTNKVGFDAFGPIIGTNIKEQLSFMPNIKVYGEIDNNINALNANKKIKFIKEKEQNSVIIAIDAKAVLNIGNLGSIRLSKESLLPGAGNNKKIESVGDYSITLSSCLATRKDNKYKLDMKTTLDNKDIFYAVNVVMESLNMAADSVISHMLKELA